MRIQPKTFEHTTHIIDAVIEHAFDRFLKYGYRKTTVDEIAHDVHISKRTLYDIFPSKEEILRESVWRDMRTIMRSFLEQTPSSTHADKVMLDLCRYIFTDRIRQGRNGMFWGIHSEDEQIRLAYLEGLKRVIRDIYRDGLRNGYFKHVDDGLATETVVRIMQAALDNFYKATEPLKLFNQALTLIADAIILHNPTHINSQA